MKRLRDFITESSDINIDDMIYAIVNSGNNKNIKNRTILDCLEKLKSGTREDILEFVGKLNETGIKYEVALDEDLGSTVLGILLKPLKSSDVLDLSFIDVSRTDGLGNAFNTNSRIIKYTCTVDLSSWDVSNVERFDCMFERFEGDIIGLEKWNTSKAVSMHCMFKDAVKFNADLSKWNVSKVEYMDHMFDKSGVKKLPSWYK